MGQDEPVAVDEQTPPVTDPVSAAALRRYQARMRPWRIAYAAAIVVVVAVALVVVKIVIGSGEISHAHLTTVAKGPAAVALQQPADPQTKRWSTSDDTAQGVPYFDGTVVTYSSHVVRGRNALTGAPTWNYTRTDRTVCTALQDNGVTVTVWRIHGDCGEMTAVDTNTGARLWDRTLDENGYPVDGQPPISVYDGQIMITMPTAIYMISTSGNNVQGSQGGDDVFMFDEQGCTINGAAMGSAGVLISQTCAHRQCSGAKFCGNGPQLLLRSLSAGYDNNSSTNNGNPDQIQWNDIGSRLLPVSAGKVVAAMPAGGGTLDVLSVDDGKTLHQVSVPSSGPAPKDPAGATVEASDAQFFHLGRTTYAMRDGASAFSWSADVPLPTLSQPNGETTDDAPSIDNAVITVPTSTGAAELDSATGKPRTSVTLDPVPTGPLYPFGTGFLTTGTSTMGFG